MSKNLMIHKGCLEYKKGKPYAVYSYAIADFEDQYAPVFHLYLAFIKRPFCGSCSGDDAGKKVVEQVIPTKEQQTWMNETIQELKRDGRKVPPKYIYEGIGPDLLSPVIRDRIMHRLKDDMPVLFDEDEIVFQIARYDSAVDRGFFDSDNRTDIRQQMESRFDTFKKDEMKKCKAAEYYKSRYTSLQKLIDNWLDGHIYIKDINNFLGESYLSLVQDEDVKALKAIDMYSDSFYATLQEIDDSFFGLIGGTWIDSGCAYRIVNSCNNENAVMGELDYYAKNKDYLARWVVRRIKGQDTTELEKRSDLKMTVWDMNTYLSNYLYKHGFGMAEKISCYDPVNDMDSTYEQEITIPYEAIRRFRETGELLVFDKEMIEKERKRCANQRLWGRGKIESFEVDYDPTNYEVVRIDIRYET